MVWVLAGVAGGIILSAWGKGLLWTEDLIIDTDVLTHEPGGNAELGQLVRLYLM